MRNAGSAVRVAAEDRVTSGVPPMKIVSRYLLAAALAVAFVASADAQGQRRGAGAAGGQPPGGRGGMMGGFGGAGLTQLVVNKSVIEELKITDEQKEKLATWAKDAGAKQREKMQEIFTGGDRPDPAKRLEIMTTMSKEQMEEVSKVLKEEQVKRLKQILLQIQGVTAFQSKETQVSLKLSDEQKAW